MKPNMGKIKTSIELVSLYWSKTARNYHKRGQRWKQTGTAPTCRIHEVLGKGTFKLCNVDDSKKVLAQMYNMTRLKLYHQRD